MKKFLLTFGLMMCGLLSSHADPTSAPPAEQIPMGYDEKGLQSGRPRTILPDVTAERSNSIVSVHVKRSPDTCQHTSLTRMGLQYAARWATPWMDSTT